MADTPLIGWTEHSQGTVIGAEKTGIEINLAQYTKVMLKVDSVGAIFCICRVRFLGNIFAVVTWVFWSM